MAFDDLKLWCGHVLQCCTENADDLPNTPEHQDILRTRKGTKRLDADTIDQKALEQERELTKLKMHER